MLKYVAVVLFSLTLFVVPANSQSKPVAVNAAEVQKVAAEREAMNSSFSGDPHQQVEQEQVKRLFPNGRCSFALIRKSYWPSLVS
jgi:hypothetical protein